MLQVLRRLVSFGDWSRNHPSEPPPGGDLDATFDALFNGLSDLEARLAEIRRDDGTLKAGSITADALDPALVSEIASLAVQTVNSQLERVETARNEAVSAQVLVDEALHEVEAAAGRALVAAQAVESAKNPVISSLGRAVAEANAVLDHARAVKDAIPNPLDFAGNAEAWADASRIWAEWMPDTIPDNTTAMMDITGDHWSSRWWANRAAQTIAQNGGAEVSNAPPTGPLAHVNGRLWWDSDSGHLYVWYQDIDSGQWVEVGPGPQPAIATVSATAPAGTPMAGQMWWNSTNANLYAWYDDGTSAQWVQVAPTPATAGDLAVPANGAIDFGAGDVTVTHSTNALAFAGGSTGYSFDHLVDISSPAAGQLRFPATQNASANANTLDDYEEQAYTPVITTLAGTLGTHSATGSCTKVGNVVTVLVDIIITVNGTGSGAVIATLPFTNGAGKWTLHGFSGAVAVFGQILPADSHVYIYKYDGTYPGGSSVEVVVSGSYTV